MSISDALNIICRIPICICDILESMKDRFLNKRWLARAVYASNLSPPFKKKANTWALALANFQEAVAPKYVRNASRRKLFLLVIKTTKLTFFSLYLLHLCLDFNSSTENSVN